MVLSIIHNPLVILGSFSLLQKKYQASMLMSFCTLCDFDGQLIEWANLLVLEPCNTFHYSSGLASPCLSMLLMFSGEQAPRSARLLLRTLLALFIQFEVLDAVLNMVSGVLNMTKAGTQN